MRKGTLKGATITSLDQYRSRREQRETVSFVMDGIEFTGQQTVPEKDFAKEYEAAYLKLYYEGYVSQEAREEGRYWGS